MFYLSNIIAMPDINEYFSTSAHETLILMMMEGNIYLLNNS